MRFVQAVSRDFICWLLLLHLCQIDMLSGLSDLYKLTRTAMAKGNVADAKMECCNHESHNPGEDGVKLQMSPKAPYFSRVAIRVG